MVKLACGLMPQQPQPTPVETRQDHFPGPTDDRQFLIELSPRRTLQGQRLGQLFDLT